MGQRDRKKHPRRRASQKSYARLSRLFFRGVDAKLDRAGEHFNEIEREVKRITAPHGDQFVTKYDRRGGEMVTRARPSLFAPRYHWSALIGDYVHNLRSALDHLGHDLVALGGGTPIAGRGGTQFPIHDSDTGPRGGPVQIELKSTQGKASKDALAFIEGLQPYRCPNNPHAHPLWVLSELDNMDKHRTLALTTVALQGFGFGIRTVQDISLQLVQIGGFAGRFDEQTKLARWKVTVTGPNPHMDVNPNGTIEIVFDAPSINAGQPVIAALTDLRDYVVDVAAVLKEIGLRTAAI